MFVPLMIDRPNPIMAFFQCKKMCDFFFSLSRVIEDNIDRSGTLDVTSGTVVGYPYYTEDDPVLQFNTEKHGYEFDKDAPLKWDPELDCEYLRDALKGWGTDERALMEILLTRTNPQIKAIRDCYNDDELTSSMKGLGTKDNRLIRIITSRSEIDMVQIKKHFLENNKQTLWKWLQDDCSGD
ncbi:unnamed protein product [Mytilus edulis]|uniref:Annexin n=1 Tax=Mytilus edulis TaxID=6550 RepID=A0A8S3QJF7_MYTED|nr:unnamed protein product [Mytilus edulis]